MILMKKRRKKNEMTKISIYPWSGMRSVEYCVRANMWPVDLRSSKMMRDKGYEFTVAIILTDDSPPGYYLYRPSIYREVYKTSFYLERDLFRDTFKKTVVSFCELLYPENKEKKLELEKSFFSCLPFWEKRESHILLAESGSFLWPVDKSLPTEEEISNKLSPVYSILRECNTVCEDEVIKEDKVA